MSDRPEPPLADPGAAPVSDAALGGRYLLRELLGVGGSAAVFRAVDTATGGEPVAVKILHPHLCATDDARASFLNEARRVEALHHPGIAQVLGSGLHESGGVTQAWIALELLEGGSLADHVARSGPLPPAQAADVVGALLDALGAAHTAGLVHRDVSPSNILLRTAVPGRPLQGRDVCLVDFGLADLTGRDTTGGDILRVTEGSGVIGNAAYLSPEQALGQPVTAAGDIYQAGAVLYFLLTGQPPYPRALRQQIAQAHVSAPPPVPSALVPAARPLDRVVTRAMGKSPEHRYPDTDTFRTDLDSAVRDATIRRVPEPSTQLTRLLPGAVPTGLAPSTTATAVRAVTPLVRPARGGVIVFLLVVVLVVGIGIATATWSGARVAPGDDAAPPTPTQSAEPSPTPQNSNEPTPTTAPSSTSPTEPLPPAAATIAVPALAGQLADVQALLARNGLSAGTITRIDSPRPQGELIEQHPAAGDNVAAGSTVDLIIASGRNVVPNVTTLDVPAAVAALQTAGFTAAATAAAPGATITTQEPVAGVSMPLGTQIVLRSQASTSTPGPTTNPGTAE